MDKQADKTGTYLCNRRRRAAGGSYPKTCPRCGISGICEDPQFVNATDELRRLLAEKTERYAEAVETANTLKAEIAALESASEQIAAAAKVREEWEAAARLSANTAEIIDGIIDAGKSANDLTRDGENGTPL